MPFRWIVPRCSYPERSYRAVPVSSYNLASNLPQIISINRYPLKLPEDDDTEPYHHPDWFKTLCTHVYWVSVLAAANVESPEMLSVVVA